MSYENNKKSPELGEKPNKNLLNELAADISREYWIKQEKQLMLTYK